MLGDGQLDELLEEIITLYQQAAVGKDVLIVENMFEDPEALAAPWHSVYKFKRERGFDQIEFICAQNDRNPINEKGEVEFRGVDR